MSKLLVAFPTYHQIPSTFFTRYLNMDKDEVVGNIVVDGVYIEEAMRLIVEKALELEGWDRLVIMESDTVPPLDALTRAASVDADIVGSIYFRHEAPHTAMVYIQEEDSLGHNPITPQTVKAWTDDPALYECHAVAFGFTSIARRVLENWDKDIKMFLADRNEINFGSHDLWFSYQARKQGFKVYVDSGIVCDHLTEVAINLQHNQDTAYMLKGATIIPFGKNIKKVLSVGSGTDRTAPDFPGYKVKTLDIDSSTKPDFIADCRDMSVVESESFDGVYCSHTVEHFEPKDIPTALSEFRRVLKPDATIRIKTPDMGKVQDALRGGAKETDIAYESSVGPITYYDIIHGHQASIKAGNKFMKHLGGFNKQSLTKALKDAGFSKIKVTADNLELKAIAIKQISHGVRSKLPRPNLSSKQK